MSAGMSFCFFSLIVFSFCSSIATNCVCKFLKGCMQFFKSYINITVGKRLKMSTGVSFCLFSLIIF